MSGSNDEPATLKRTMNPKRRAMYTELKDIDINNLSSREQTLIRIINDLEEKFDKLE